MGITNEPLHAFNILANMSTYMNLGQKYNKIKKSIKDK